MQSGYELQQNLLDSKNKYGLQMYNISVTWHVIGISIV